MSHLNTNNLRPLISRNPTYSINRKHITFHTEDRDIVHWPKANEFEIRLPQTLTNVESMRLVEIMLPVNYYSFSSELQNITMQITYDGTTSIITIDEGFNLFLSEHPVEYQTAEAADPVDHTPVATTTPPGTTTPVETTSDTEESSDLPLPVPIIPVLSAFGIITIVIRKRK